MSAAGDPRQGVSEYRPPPRREYHSHTGLPVGELEDDLESEDDVTLANAANAQDSVAAISAISTIPPSDTHFMALWTLFVAVHPVTADFSVGSACAAFAAAHRDDLRADGMLQEVFACHLAHLLLTRALGTRDVARCMVELGLAESAPLTEGEAGGDEADGGNAGVLDVDVADDADEDDEDDGGGSRASVDDDGAE